LLAGATIARSAATRVPAQEHRVVAVDDHPTPDFRPIAHARERHLAGADQDVRVTLCDLTASRIRTAHVGCRLQRRPDTHRVFALRDLPRTSEGGERGFGAREALGGIGRGLVRSFVCNRSEIGAAERG
jgi:hypothetical protein